MAATTNGHVHDEDDVFSSPADAFSPSYHHRFSSRFDNEPLDLSSTSSPSQLKRTIEAHLQETDRRLEHTQQLGTSLLKQREDLTSKLEEVEQYQDEAQIPPDLQSRLADIEKEHADVSREVARALIAPKPKQEDSSLDDSGVFTSQATGSPTKVSAPSRRHRNQPSTRAGDLQFAADISTSLLAQVRQLQATVAERDDTLRRVNAEREAIEHDLHNHTQKVRALDESEQKYKDENWNLETQRHELLTAAKDAQDKEKRLNAGLASATAERNRLQNELEDLRMNHSKLSEEHTAARKAHDTEIHALKRNADLADTDRQSLQDKIDELVSQNQELAKAISNRSRARQISPGEGVTTVPEESNDRLDTPGDSPPASPTKATPRHGALESETLKSSLHHSHRMIQNLKAQNHREKTEKIELRRMLQEARDELESRREGGSAAKRQRTKPEIFKKPARPDMLGGTRRVRTDVELTDDDWEDQNVDSPSHARSVNILPTPRGNFQHLTDFSDAYQTANDTEGTFDTADERNTTESEAFMTGAESLAGDSTDELTETEDTASITGRTAPGRVSRIISARPAGDRIGYASNVSASADVGDNIQTPVQSSFTKFKLRNNRASNPRQAQLAEENTPESSGYRSVSHDSPASTVTGGQSPAIGEQSLFAELGGMDEINSEANSTPARSSTMSSARSTPGYTYTPSKAAAIAQHVGKTVMVDSSTMTEPWIQETTNTEPAMEKKLLPSAFPLPPSAPSSPLKRGDDGTQFTPQRGMSESPSRPTSSHITPPRTVWDEVHEPSTPGHVGDKSIPQHQYSGVLAQDSMPVNSPSNDRAATRAQLEQLQADLAAKETELRELRKSNAAALTAAATSLESLRDAQATAATERRSQLEGLQSSHAADVAKFESQMEALREAHASNLSTKDSELEGLRGSHAAALAATAAELDILRGAHMLELASRQTEFEGMRSSHSSALAKKESEVEDLHRGHAAEIMQKETELNNLRTTHATVLKEKEIEAANLHNSHAAELDMLRGQLTRYKEEIEHKQVESDGLRSSDAAALASSQAEVEQLRVMHATESDKLKAQIASQSDEVSRKRRELETLRNIHSDELDKLRGQISGYSQEMGTQQTEFEKLAAVHSAELQGLRRQVSDHNEEMSNKEAALQALRSTHNNELEGLQGRIAAHTQQIGSKQSELETMQSAHNQELERMRKQIDDSAQVVGKLQARHEEELAVLQSQIATYTHQLGNKQSELEALQLRHQEELNKLRKKVDVKDDLIQRQYADHSQELGRLHGEIYSHRQEVEQLQNALRASDARHAALKGSGYSSILTQETHPTPPQPTEPVRSGRFRRSPERPRTAEKMVGGGSILGSAAGASGLAAANKNRPTTVREDDTGGATDSRGQSTPSALKDISGNSVPTRGGRNTDDFGGPLTRPTMSDDQVSQTLIPGEQLDQASKPRKTPLAPVVIPARNQSPGTRTPVSPTRYPRRSTSRTREVSPIIENPTAVPSTPPPRPSSVTSNRSSTMVSQSHPPLPSDHKDIIAKANQNVSPTRQGSTIRQGRVMGPPIMPASAMRRSKTPTESVRTASRVGQNGKRATGSQMSRRSSVSSFASELDERFNIRTDQQAPGPGFVAGPGTDPRMIQAITQTMIGEYLWKYTRKTGSKEMSSTRHRRYFWVHPYTKTLYWSDQDPQTAGRAELKAKSVAIESVRVVSDDNPMPPGLHRKSLEVTTPGRKVKFTASTGQRHETWFNALSYLLHRAEEDASGTAAGSGNDITNEDIAEFSVNGYGARLVPNDSRMSMSSYNSRTTAGTSRRVGRQSMPVGGVTGSSTSQLPQSHAIHSPSMNSNNDTIRRSRLEVPPDRDRTIRGSSASRISKMFGSMTNRTKTDNAPNAGDSSSRYRETSSIYDASVVSDGRNAEEEEARRQREQVEKPGLEDVRACCDGKHHVGSLAHRHHAPTSSTQNRFNNAINRSMSRRT